eukprot:s303_g1.t1
MAKELYQCASIVECKCLRGMSCLGDIPSPVPFSNASSLLASLQQRGSPSVDLAGRFFQHTDESGLLPAALARSTASRKAETEEIPGMYGYAREINRLMLEDPPWSFTSLEQPSAACAAASQCRLVTTDAPSDALASRDLGSAVAVELFRVARQKERLWHRVVFDNQTFHQKLASELSAFDEVHAQLATLVDTSAQLLEALPRRPGAALPRHKASEMNELAGGFYRGDKVLCNGRPGMIFGKPARAACTRISVSVMYEDGTVNDERVVNLQLIEDLECLGRMVQWQSLEDGFNPSV